MSVAFTSGDLTIPVAAPVALPGGSLADLVSALGDLPLARIRMRPAPGTATDRDVVEADLREDRLCELVDGVLVEKAMGYMESALAALLIEILGGYVRRHRLGVVSGESGMLRLMPGLVRIPDVAFVAADRLPADGLGDDPIPSLVPDLAIEVLSRGNTPREMARKLREYFTSGARLIWYFDPAARNCTVYTSVDAATVLAETDTLTGGEVLPGFSLPLSELYGELDRQLGRT